MATNESGEFEKALARIDAIVKQLEGGSVDLDESVKLFREGRELSRRCEELLKNAQAAVEAAANDAPRANGPAAAPPPGQLPF
jgi:exodeoxyribonuclease VII small subunit